VMEYGVLLSCGHALGDEDLAYVCANIDQFLDSFFNTDSR
jgi:hypothetical protein